MRKCSEVKSALGLRIEFRDSVATRGLYVEKVFR
jgi:hypothetical protein